MAHQYFEDNTSLTHDFQQYDVIFQNERFNFETDSGVFSKTGLDFGSRTLLEGSLQLNEVPKKILDLGTGYGPIGVILARHFSNSLIHSVDVNERALELAKKNQEKNQIQNMKIFPSNAYESIEDKDYDWIITNPPIRAGKKVVHTFIEEGINHLKSGGRLILVIQKKQGAPSAKKKMEDVYGNVEQLLRNKGYWVLTSIKK